MVPYTFGAQQFGVSVPSSLSEVKDAHRVPHLIAQLSEAGLEHLGLRGHGLHELHRVDAAEKEDIQMYIKIVSLYFVNCKL
jgi:hypothetical protein